MKEDALPTCMVWKKEGTWFLWQRKEPGHKVSMISGGPWLSSRFASTGQMTSWWHFSPVTEIWISWSHTAGTMPGSISSPYPCAKGKWKSEWSFGSFLLGWFEAAREKLRMGERHGMDGPWPFLCSIWNGVSCQPGTEITRNVSHHVIVLYTFSPKPFHESIITLWLSFKETRVVIFIPNLLVGRLRPIV